MGSDTHTPQTPTLVRTKLHRPRLAAHLITRPHLLERMSRGFQRQVILDSALAGCGKTTLANSWLLEVFLSYFIAAIQSLFPESSPTMRRLLTAPQNLSLDHLTITLINEIAELTETRLRADPLYDLHSLRKA